LEYWLYAKGGRNMISLLPGEQAKFKKIFYETKGSRDTQTTFEELNEYLIEEWGCDYQIVQSRSPDNRDCIIRRISTGQELSAAKAAKVLTNNDQPGSNKIVHMALVFSKGLDDKHALFCNRIKTIYSELRGCFTNELL